MRRLLFPVILVCVCCSQQLFAQWNNTLLDSTHTHKLAIGIYGNGDVASNSVTTTFAYNYLQGSYITDNMKQQVVSNLKQQNRLGYNFNYGIYATLLNDSVKKHTFNFFVAIRHKKYLNAEFSGDDFNIPFYGNASYAGKTAQLSPFSFNNLSYQQLELGLVCTDLWKGAKLGGGLSFLVGQEYTSITAKSASLYTDPYGQYLTFSSNAQFMESDTTPNRLINGYGASLDIYFSMPYKIAGKSGTFSISATDIGFLWWNKNSLTYQKDTSYTYNGISINSISDLQNAAFNTLNQDSLQKKYIPLEKKSFYTPIPTTLKISANTILTEKLHLEIGYWYIFNANDVSYFYLQGDKYFTHSWMGSLQIGYGGYTGFNVSLMLAKEFKHSRINLTLNHLQGIIVPNNFGGAGLYLGYAYLL